MKQSHIQIDPITQLTSCIALNNGSKLIIIIAKQKGSRSQTRTWGYFPARALTTKLIIISLVLDLAWLQSAIISFGLMKVIIRVLCKNVGGCLNSQQGGTIQDTEAEWICCEENMFYLELTEYSHKDPHFDWSHFFGCRWTLLYHLGITKFGLQNLARY